MSETLLGALPFVLPPLLGAVIGYVTNYVAIRMLFRPLSAKYVLGLRIPLTPGIIPKQRYQLAESIGRMVSTQLLNEEAVRVHLSTPEFRRAVEQGVRTSTDRLLETVPASHDWSTLSALGDVAREGARGMLRRFMASDSFRDGVLAVARNMLFEVSRYRVRSLAPSPGQLRSVLETVVSRAAGGELREAVKTMSHEWLEQRLADNTPMSRYISDGFIAEVERVADDVYGPSFEHLLEWLDRPDIREQLQHRGKGILRKILDQLTFMQRFFVTAAQYDRQLEERMPVIVDDLINTIRTAGWEPANRRRVVGAVGDALRKIQSQGFAEAVGKSRLDLPVRVHHLIDEVADILERETVQQRIVDALLAMLERYEGRTIGEVLESFFAMDLETIAVRISDRVSELVKPSEQGAVLVGEAERVLRDFTSSLGSVTIREMLDLGDEEKERVDAAVAGGLTSLVERRLPQLVESLDIQRLVVNRVNSLDVGEVERLLLMVIARHLKWINLFGALLGAVIGGSQVVIGYVM
jgi:uncharacterized membrane protein YheB (UPF0754 family)